jgi:hypothetical protein
MNEFERLEHGMYSRECFDVQGIAGDDDLVILILQQPQHDLAIFVRIDGKGPRTLLAFRRNRNEILPDPGGFGLMN